MQRQRPRFETEPPGTAGITPAHPRMDAALNEARTLVLVALVMLGFQYRAGFEPGLGRLPAPFADLKLGSMGLMLLSLGFLLLPTTYHRLVLRGEEREEMGRVASRSVAAALVPFALSLGLDVTIAVVAVAGVTLGWSMGGAASALALLFWFGSRLVGGTPSTAPTIGRFAGIALPPYPGPAPARNRLEAKIDHVLAEIRLALPGAQALLGFQFSVTLMPAFESMPEAPRIVYLVSLALIALATILLMTPSAVHRIVERGESTERFHRFAGRMLMAGVAVLALALSGDVYVVASRVERFAEAAPAAAAATALFFYILWFGVPILRRRALGSRVRTFERG